MKPFIFSLQAVRTLRQRQEQAALEAFGAAVRARQAAVDRRQQAERQLAATHEQLTLLQTEGAAIHHLNQVRGHCAALEQRLTAHHADCARAQTEANAAWEKLQDARQALELVDKLHARRRDQHERQLREEEQKQLDEMSARRWSVNLAGGQSAGFAWN